jgi:hypothetical protein
LDSNASQLQDVMGPKEVEENRELFAKIVKVFSTKHWKEFQEYGLFCKIYLEAGKKAKKLFVDAQKELSGNEPDPKRICKESDC